MRRVVGIAAAVSLAVRLAVAAEDLPAEVLAGSGDAVSAAPSVPAPALPAATLLVFSGSDMWRHGSFAHVGVLWSPDGLHAPGFTLKLLGNGGLYQSQVAPPLPQSGGAQLLAAVLPGWRFKMERLELTVAAGIDLQHHRLWPDDPDSRYRGAHLGLRVGADLWYEPTPELMAAVNVSATSIGPSYWSRAAAGLRLFDAVWLGPELHLLGDPTYQQVRIGAHATALSLFGYEWSAGAGYVGDSDHRRGPYIRFGLLARR